VEGNKIRIKENPPPPPPPPPKPRANVRRVTHNPYQCGPTADASAPTGQVKRAHTPPPAPAAQVITAAAETDVCHTAGFRSGQSFAPTLAPGIFSGHYLSRIEIYPEPAPHAFHVAETALQPATRQRHRKRLLDAQQFLHDNPEWRARPLAEAMVRFLEERAANPPRGEPWQPQTTFREATSLLGAMSWLPLYSTAPQGIPLMQSAQFRGALATWRLAAQQAQPMNQRVVTVEDMIEAVELCMDQEARVMLMLMWLTAGRPGDVQQLQAMDVLMGEEGQLMVSFRHGKAVRMRGPYSVPTSAADATLWRDELKQYIEARKAATIHAPWENLFPSTSQGRSLNGTLLNAIRVSNPELNLRAIRRGSLQTMAVAGVPLNVLRKYSGHTNDAMLLRYLNWGKEAGQEAAQARAAARPLSGLDL